MATARDYCINGLYDCGELAEGDDASPEQISRALRDFNALFSRWNAESLMRYSKTSGVFSGSTSSFLIGPTGDIVSSPRPKRIDVVKTTTNLVLQPLSVTDMAKLESSSGTPAYFSYDPTMSNGIVRIWPTPAESYTYTVTFYNVYGSYGLNDTITISPEYEDLLKWSLADRLAKSFGYPRMDLQDEAQRALRVVKYSNVSLNQLPVNNNLISNRHGINDV